MYLFIRRAKWYAAVLYILFYKGLAAALVVAAPYATLFADRYAYLHRGFYGAGGEFLVPIILLGAAVAVYGTGKHLALRYYTKNTAR